ncbi:hypothetical protein [Halobellus rubicundus]|uniref:Zinc finger FPG/IleRS-type domain-containing protein n=1 Tax=Halobellus rubicundus TaxID=2996466 RepID=A0ABD5MBH2_9EURY
MNYRGRERSRMDCPRCGRPLSTITIAGGDGEATYCERCRFADVTSEFEPNPDAEESWDEAIDRFRQSLAEAPLRNDDEDGAAGETANESEEEESDESADAEAEVETDTEAEAESDAEAEAESDIEAGVETEAESDADSEVKAETESDAEAKSESESESDAESDVQPQADSAEESESATESDSDSTPTDSAGHEERDAEE